MEGPAGSSGWGEAFQRLFDAVRTTFGLAVLVVIFPGLALLLVVSGMDEPPSTARLWFAVALVALMMAVLLLVGILRLCKPEGLSGPLPETDNITIQGSDTE